MSRKKHKDPYEMFGKVRLRLYVEVEPPEYDEEHTERMKRLGKAHRVTHKHTEVFTGLRLFAEGEEPYITAIIQRLYADMEKKVNERAEAEFL